MSWIEDGRKYHEVPEQLIELQIMEKANCRCRCGYGYGWGKKKEMGGKTQVAFSCSFM